MLWEIKKNNHLAGIYFPTFAISLCKRMDLSLSSENDFLLPITEDETLSLSSFENETGVLKI